MRTVSSCGVEIRKQNIPVRQTLEIYRSAVSYLTEIYEQVWEELAEIPDAKRRFNAAEHLVHTTKKNPARFDFDLRFPKMPSYLRRAAIQHALGSVSSYETRMDLWEKSGEKAGKPRLAYENHAMPVFYRDVMYREEKEGKAEAEKLLTELGYPQEVIERVSYLVGHHHSYDQIEGMDYQILVEADFIVNMYEDAESEENCRKVCKRIFKTESGTRIFKEMFGI